MRSEVQVLLDPPQILFCKICVCGRRLSSIAESITRLRDVVCALRVLGPQLGAARALSCRKPLSRTHFCRWQKCGALAQLGERLICIQEVIGSIPIGSTRDVRLRVALGRSAAGLSRNVSRAGFEARLYQQAVTRLLARPTGRIDIV